ncbi:MAG: hypothetical protein M3292_12465, partial [Actinomycetota bacterium]|nr:hypothetical protein [Actinomycetota bacterium]
MATPKQRQRRGRLTLVLGAILTAALVVGIAYADVVKNDVTNDTGIGGVREITLGQTTSANTINYWIQATGGTCD